MAPTPTPTQSHLYIEVYLQQNNLEHLVMFFVKMLNSKTVEELGTHQTTINRIPEQMYSPSDIGLGMAWGGHYLCRSRIKAAGPKCKYYLNNFQGYY